MRSLRPFVRLIVPVSVIALAWSSPVFADTAGVAQVQSFLQSVIQVLVTIAGLLAAGFLVVGGIGYITSSGNPRHMERAKHTIVYAGVGLAICLGAFVISGVITGLATNAFGK